MASTWNFYDQFTNDLLNGFIDLNTNTIKVMIVTNSYTPNQATHTRRSDITNEVSGTGYTAGGATLANKLTPLDTTNHWTKFTADAVSWNPVTFTNGRYAIMYKSRGGAASADELIGYVDFGANHSPAAANFTISWNATNGIFRCKRT